MADPARQEAIQPRVGSEARAVGALLIGGAGLVALSLLLPHPSGGDTPALIGTALAMALAGLLSWGLSRRVPLAVTHFVLGGAVAATGLLIAATGAAVGQYGTIFVWATLVAAYFFPRRVAAAHLAWLLGVYAVALALVDSTGGYSPLTRWVFSAVSLGVVMLFTSVIVARRARADRRARSFFDLSHDLLSTGNLEGYFVELNGAWKEALGYEPDELRARPFLDFVHPDDRELTELAASGLYEGADVVAFENRYLAKDGTWHWLRWSSALAPEESLVYARATDVTELKQIEAEREELLVEVGKLARSDALTGLPNRRVLDELLPREMARARRTESPLCVAIVDMDHFKAYNDTHGHLAGDTALRKCAIAWDSELRGSDTIVRFGGEEFLALLPDCGVEQAAEIVEGLRAVTANEQTCSAGLACWDFTETVESLVERADVALYEAKANGRDRLVRSPG